MDATTAASTIAGPIGDVAGNFYFSKQAIARGEAIGLDVVSLYGAGRASMLGGVDPETADALFYFFKPGMIAAVVARGRSLASEDAIAAAHLGAADDYAEATFAAVDSATLGAFTDAVGALVANGSVRLLAALRWLPFSPGGADGRRSGLPGRHPVARAARRCAHRCGESHRALACHCLSVQPRRRPRQLQDARFLRGGHGRIHPRDRGPEGRGRSGDDRADGGTVRPALADPTRGDRRWHRMPS